MNDIFTNVVRGLLQAQQTNSVASELESELVDMCRETIPEDLHPYLGDIHINAQRLIIGVSQQVVAVEIKQFYAHEMEKKIKEMKNLDNSYKIKISVQVIDKG